MAVKTALAPHVEVFALQLHPHAVTLADIARGESVFFFLRDPIQRFVSGFNSRLRQGRPRLNRPWNEGEARAFGIFSTPNALAEALAVRRDDALEAMAQIRHVNHPLSYWIGTSAILETRLCDVVWIGRTETLPQDFAVIRERLGLPASAALPEDEIGMHRTPQGMETWLSDQGRAAIAAWYADDYRLLDAVDRFRMRLL